MRRELGMTIGLLMIAMATSSLLGCPAKAENTEDTAGHDLLVDASSLPTKLKEKIAGPTRILELVIYPQLARAQIQDPTKKLNVDELVYRNGAVHDGGPVKFIGNQPTEKDLAEVTFPIEDVDFSHVPRMAKDAPLQLGVDGGKVTHMILKRPLPYEKEVRWAVYVTSDRRDGSVEYDVRGLKKKVWQ